jgi:ribosome-associated protein
VLTITETIGIADEEISWTFARSGGPGGQNVNKVASKAILRWKPADNQSIPEEAKARLLGQQRRRITNEGELLIQGQRYRDQERNKEDCLERLREMILAALEAPIPRKATKPTRGSKRRRLQAKKEQSEKKQRRREVE